MASNFGISMRTYQDWKLGRAKPQAAATVMTMLGSLEDNEIIRTVKKNYRS